MILSNDPGIQIQFVLLSGIPCYFHKHEQQFMCASMFVCEKVCAFLYVEFAAK